ncbi:hypothetical protein [Bradyrhizobium sp. AUGA SZCCT0283]|uniref:hypothetical protein n=1 Tax=Bradyrhizobium sp. AUGA SZCCT0283 TaxID=2807671 RepID=UPI001BAA4DD8|nr:hypothetical protein [Bradyrhizobium sp. AUGA SZCCT0283]MBR1280355.1 hypothetical protein [Bradyrhizobium sp. AUGA SZCCT0283]
MKFALELFVPERLMHSGGGLASDPKQELQHAAPGLEVAEPAQSGRARRFIEEVDYEKFGGPSFGPRTIELMSKALEDAEASLPQPASDQQLRLIAAAILKVAGDGERDPIRLTVAALSALGTVGSEADAKPPTT